MICFPVTGTVVVLERFAVRDSRLLLGQVCLVYISVHAFLFKIDDFENSREYDWIEGEFTL